MKHRIKALFGGAVIGWVFAWLGRQSGALPASWSPFIMGALGGIASAVMAVGWTEGAVLDRYEATILEQETGADHD